jgi:hypothetical protein
MIFNYRMKYFNIFFVCTALMAGCNSKKEKNYNKENLVSFCNVYKDSVFVETYTLQKEKKEPHHYFYYHGNDGQDFSLIYDSLDNELRKINTKKGDTTALEFEEKKYYIENDNVFGVFEFIEDKNVTDGAVAYYFNPKLGLLAQRSKTWRISKFILFSESDTNYVLGQALLYNIFANTAK